MIIKSINNEPSFQAYFPSNPTTQKVLTAIKKDFMCQPAIRSCEPINELLSGYSKICMGEAYRLSIENNKLIMTSVIPHKYRNFEPINESLSESFLKLLGKFVNLKSSH